MRGDTGSADNLKAPGRSWAATPCAPQSVAYAPSLWCLLRLAPRPTCPFHSHPTQQPYSTVTAPRHRPPQPIALLAPTALRCSSLARFLLRGPHISSGRSASARQPPIDSQPVVHPGHSSRASLLVRYNGASGLKRPVRPFHRVGMKGALLPGKARRSSTGLSEAKEARSRRTDPGAAGLSSCSRLRSERSQTQIVQSQQLKPLTRTLPLEPERRRTGRRRCRSRRCRRWGRSGRC